MANFSLTRSAKDNLRDIAKYSIEKWGKAQSKKYIDAMYARFRQIAAKRLRGKNQDEFLTGLRSLNHASHVIFYIFVGEDVLIINVLHGAMEFELHLDLPE